MQYSAVTWTEALGEVVGGEVVEGEVVEGEADRKDENRTSGTYGPIFLKSHDFQYCGMTVI